MKKSAGPEERQPQLTSTVTAARTEAWAAESVFPLQSPWRCEEVHCCGMCVTAAACQRGTNIQRLEEEMPPKDPLSFMQPRTSTACFIFKAYPVTKDTSVLHLDYMWTSVSSCVGVEGVNVSLSCPQASLCPTCFLMAWGADKSHLSACCQDTRWCGC